MHKFSLEIKRLFISLIIGLVFVFSFSQLFTKPTQAATGINRQINFQGKLVNNPLSTNVTDTSYTVVFTFYDNASGGTQLWQETQTVTTSGGIFRVALGSVTPFPANFNFNWSGLYLGIKVSAPINDPEMTPRIQMAAVPFAFNAEKVAGLTVQDSASSTGSTSATLKIGTSATNPITVDLGLNNVTFSSGAYNGSTSLTVNTTNGVATSITLPTGGTLLTNTTAANQTITSTQTSGNILSLADSTGLTSAITGLTVGLTASTNSQNKTGISFDLSGGTGGTYYDLLGSGSTWSITRAGVLSVASCSGCGGGGTNFWGSVGGLNYPLDTNSDLAIGSTSTASAIFSFTGVKTGQTIASLSGQLIVMANNGWGGNASLSGQLVLGAFSNPVIQTTKNQGLIIGGNTTGQITLSALNGTQNIKFAGYTTAGCTLKTDASGLVTCGADNTGSSGADPYWNQQSGALFANNSTVDFLVGGQSSASAGFRVTGQSPFKGTLSVASVSGNTSFATFIVDQSGVGDLFTASAAGNTLFVVRNNGAVTIGGNRDSGGYKLDVIGSARVGNNTTGDDIVKKTTSDFTQSGYSVTTGDSVNDVSTTNNQISLITDLIGAGATPTAPAVGPAVGVNISAGGFTFQRPDKNFIVIIGGSTGGANSTKMYNVTSNTFDAAASLNSWIPTGGFQAFQRQNGKFVLLPGGASTNTLIYDAAGSNNFGSVRIGAPVAVGGVGVGSQLIRRSDGKVLIINGGGLNSTNLYDPVATSSATNTDSGTFLTGPTLTSTVTTGSFAFQKPNGQWIVGLGGVTTTNVYDQMTTGAGVSGGGTFAAGPTLSAASGAGAHAIQMPDGRWLIILGGGTAATSIYNPTSNAFTAGPSLASADTVGAGGHSFQRSDGKWVVVIGGNSLNLQLYDPTTGDGSFSQLTGANGLQGATGAGAGAHTFQRPDGMFVIVHGNGTGLTTVYDGGWNTAGTWTSEDLNSTKISTYSALMWSSNPQSANNNARLDAETLSFSVKKANSQADLTNAQWTSLQDSGDLLKAYDTSRWIKIKVDFSTPVRSYSGNATFNISQRNTWGGEGETFYRRTFIQPTVFNMRVVNPLVSYGDPSGQGDPAFGRNFATASATLEGVITDNSNWLKLQTIRNSPTATPSGGFIIASGSANLTGLAGAGAHAIERSTGQFLIIHGNNLTTTSIYDPDSNTFSVGPTLPFAAGAGAHSFLMPDGRFFIVLGNTTNNTAIFDTQANAFLAGPKLYCSAAAGANTFQRPDGFFMTMCAGNTRQTSMLDPFTMAITQGPFPTAAVGNGSLNIRRADGRIILFLGQAQTITNLYDPATNAFQTGPALATSTVTTGSYAVQLFTGKWFIKTSTTASNTYDPNTNIFAVANTTTPSVGAGAAAIPRSDGKFLAINGGNAATTSVFETQLSTGLMPAGPTLPCNVNTGGFVFQRQTGEYVLICGGGTTNTAIIDAGWNLGGTYTSEQIYEPNLSSITGMYWKNQSGQGEIYVKYRTASSQTALGLSSWKLLPSNGSLLSITNGDTWFQTRIDLQGELQDQPGAKTRVWLASDSGGDSVYYRSIQAPVLQYWKLINAQDPNILTLTSNGSNVFRFNADGQAFTSEGGAWNSGGADLAERYTSSQALQAGEVVIGDRLHPQNVIRSTDSYQSNIMGVVSTQPGFVAGSYTPNSYPIALVGRVPVKISTENGAIHAGDYLTSASIPGFAMKATFAGRVLGTALEDFDPVNATQCPNTVSGTLPSTQCGIITAFINLTNYNGQSVEMVMADKGFLASDSAEVNGLNTSSGLTSYMNNVALKDNNILSFLENLKNQGDSATLGSEIFTGKLSAVTVVSPNIIADLITAKRIKADHIEGLEILTNQISALQDNMSVLGLATESARLSGLPGELNLSSLNVEGLATVSGNLTVKGNSLVQGFLDVLDTISTPKLLVSDFASFFGNVFFKKNVVFEGRPMFNSDTAGFAVINKGDQEVSIEFDQEYYQTPIVTASIALDKSEDASRAATLENAVLNGNISYVITQRTTKGFVIKLNKAASEDISFSWVVLSINNAKTIKSIDSKGLNFTTDSTKSAAFQSILNQLGN